MLMSAMVHNSGLPSVQMVQSSDPNQGNIQK